MMDQDYEEPHRPMMPPSPGWAGDGSMASEQEAANKMFAYNNAQLREQGVQILEQDAQKLETNEKSPAGAYQTLKNEHEAHAVAEAELAARIDQIKAEHGVRIAGDLHQRGLSDGPAIEGAVNAFATDAATNGLQSSDIQAMAAADYDKALTEAAVRAQADREETARLEAAAAAQAAPEAVSSAEASSAQTRQAAEQAPGVEPSAQGEVDPRQERFERLGGSETQTTSEIERGQNQSAAEDFSAAGGEVTDARAERLARLSDTAPSESIETPSAEAAPERPLSSRGLGE